MLEQPGALWASSSQICQLFVVEAVLRTAAGTGSKGLFEVVAVNSACCTPVTGELTRQRVAKSQPAVAAMFPCLLQASAIVAKHRP